jgi:triacylglycerol lipase
MTAPSGPWTRRAAIAAAGAAALVGPAHAEDLPWRLPKLKFTRVHGSRIAFFEKGDGPPLVLVHGMSGSPALEWGRVFEPLSRKFRVIAPYQIGFGPSDQPDLAYDSATFVDYLGGFLHARVAEGATLVGESFGGWVVARYAMRVGQKSAWKQILPPISHLVIVDGAVQMHPLPNTDGGAQESINSPEVGKLAHDFFVSQPKVDNSLVTKSAGRHVMAEQLTDADLKALKVPTLVIWGRDDRLLPLSDGRHIASLIPGAHSVIIGDCGHIPSVEQPRAFLGALGGALGMDLENL